MQPDGYPGNWNAYDRTVLHVGAGQFSFVGSTGDVNRFGARFRAASMFRGVRLEGYSENTASGYSALYRVMFVWSAFESFMAICGLDQRSVSPIFNARGSLEVIDRIRNSDPGNGFYQFTHQRVNAAHRSELESYFKQDPCNVAYLASAIRHIFAHGSLTPNANQAEPWAVVAVCDTLCSFLLNVMDQEFSSRVAEGMSAL